MNLQVLTRNFTPYLRKIISAILLTSGTLAWFFVFQLNTNDIFRRIVSDPSWVIVAHIIFYTVCILSAIVGSLFAKKVSHQNFLSAWIVLGLFSTISLIFFQGPTFTVIVSVLLAISFGLGLPGSMAMLADSTQIEKRGRVSGITILLTFIMAFIALALQRAFGGGTTNLLLFMVVIRSISILGLIRYKGLKDVKISQSKFQQSKLQEFIFYIIPWVIFTVSAGLAWNQVPGTVEYSFAKNIGTILRYMFIALFGIIWGIVADRIGRKQPIYIGLILLGVSFALLGFAMSPFSVFVYLSLSGVAWGSFFTMYLIIPGDLSKQGSREWFYAIGTISPIIILFGLNLIPEDLTKIFSESSFSQILSLILFLAIIPVNRAKETLEESKIRQRKLKNYTEKVGKIIQESKE